MRIDSSRLLSFVGGLILLFVCGLPALQWPEADVFLVEPSTQYVESSEFGDVWETPIVRWEWLSQGLMVSKWAAVVLATGLIFVLQRCILASESRLLRATAAVLLALSWTPERLIVWCWLLLFSIAIRRITQATQRWKAIAFLGLAIGGTILTTDEFSIVLISAVILSWGKQFESNNKSKKLRCFALSSIISLLIIFPVLAGSLISEPFALAFLQPITAVRLSYFTTPFSELRPTVENAFAATTLSTAALIVLINAVSRPQNTGCRWSTRAGVALMFGIGLSSKVYVDVAAVMLLLWAQPQEPQGLGNKLATKQRLGWLPVAFVVGLLAASIYQTQSVLLGNPLRNRLVDLAGIDFPVKILLTDADQTSTWKTNSSPGKGTLVFDTRFDRFSPQTAEDLQQTISDLLRGRRELYQLADSGWGGTRHMMSLWEPDLIAVDSRDQRAIRQLSLNPGWNVIAIDGRRTVVASSDHPALNFRAREASALWFFLEWPNPSARVQVEGFLEPGNTPDSVVVAGVFNAMRLPYAALRVLPEGDGIERGLQELWSYTELSIRSGRQNGTLSLLDHIRAHQWLSRLRIQVPLQTGQIHEQLDRTERALADVAVTLEEEKRGSGQKENRSPILLQVRAAVANGDLVLAHELSPDLATDSNSKLLKLALSADYSDLASIRDNLLQLADSPNCSETTREEVLFYAGCINLELRQIPLAIEYFSRAAELNSSRFRGLIRLYLTKLTQ